ncbi:MAG TPA: choice-of-anchor D domain-containing protein, partial [Candidatus Kapabacteria bacterium]|nr:choice-of-anchor D domain-containing protein [Candidatus Kapabacteria bacterium]
LPLFISSARMEGTVDSSIFTVSPATINQVLTPGDSISLDLCFTPSDTALFFDTLIVPLECASFHYPLGGFGVTPLIYATDLDFGEVDSGQTKCLPLTIRNPGKAPLTITAQDLVNDSNFTVDSNIFPITIMPGGSITIEYCFHPQSWGSFSRRVTFLNLNPTTFQHSIKDTSLLSGTAGNAGVNSASPNLPFALFISPNPTSGVATITLPQAGSTAPRVGSVEIFDVLGREVANFRVSGSYEWQMGALPAGTYIVRAEAGGAVVSSRVVKE